ncbi:DoxX family protein [Siphonobacter sp. BAB-5385]|uniref:DoxX family membrane protein n=1 Tax=Siphonobacter sp. BAB-5385 TaxID=1864822 RepID=UPI000B9DFFF4|nr:DoxX family membrane protein [Siphonobacter sp. BAB-5385]OZI08307.1 DoxX family protein [Siphonobacter sp. BAB-5385]
MNQTLAFILARLALAMSMLGHGLVRIPKLNGFSAWMLGKFKDSMLPEVLVLPFSYALPVAELLVGVLLLIGWMTRQALVAGAVVMILLIFGSSMIEDWGAIPSQLIHAAYCCILLVFVDTHNAYAVDKRLR